MTTLLIWKDKNITIFPWDTTTQILHRISKKEKVPVSFIQVKQDFSKLLQSVRWGEQDVDIPIEVKNLTEEWDNPDIITTMKKLEKDPDIFALYVRYKTENDEIDDQLWDTLFRHDFQDMSFQEWKEHIKETRNEEKIQQKEADYITQLYKELSIEEQKQIVGWKSEKHRLLVEIKDIRPIASLFTDIQLGEKWKLALFYQKVFRWGEKDQWIVKMRRMKDPSIEQIVHEMQENQLNMDTGIYLYHQEMGAVFIQEKETNIYHIQLEKSNEHPDLVALVLEALGVSEIKKETDIGMVGGFVFPQLYMDIPLFQDMCMNDPVVSHFMYINELKKATFENVIGVSLLQDIKDAFSMDTIKSHDFTIKNVHRQSGFQVDVSLNTPILEQNLPSFFLFMRQIIGRYIRRRPELLDEYLDYIPDFKKILEKLQKPLVKNVKSATRPEYISKYPRMFVRNLYSVICQKNLQPALINEEDTYNLPKESYIRFPSQPMTEINPEYYYCPNPDYPYAGLKEMDLKGKDIFINLAPCCFNSPQDKENERKLSKLRTKDEEEAKEKEKVVSKNNVISGKFLIKYPSQLGTIRPPSMNRFFMAYDPFTDYFRVGVEQTPSSLISCLLMRRTMMGVSTPFDAVEVRRKIAEDSDCVRACLQENPGLNMDEIKVDIANPNVYFDPRRFYRAIELYFGVRVLVFSKEQDIMEEDAHLLLPFSMRTHYTNHSDLPFTIIFEHWGGKTNILSKFKHPHCELVGFKTFTEANLRFDFSPKGIFQLLDYTIFPFDGNQAIQPFFRKECWFFPYIIGQTTDPLGKVRWLHFQYYNLNFYAEIYPPIAIQDDIGVGELPEEIPIIKAKYLLKFLNKFDKWEQIHVPDPEDDVVYWTVSQENVLWKSLEENSKLSLTFVLRLEKPQPDNVYGRDDTLKKYIETTAPDKMIYKPSHPQTPPSVGHHEKIANILSQLCVSGFSHFLKENKVKRDAVDMDVLIQTFTQQKIKINMEHVYPNKFNYKTEDYKDFMSGKKIVLPSLKFLQKIQFHLRWLIFYQPQYLFDPQETMVNPFQQIADFSIADPSHYYCGLDEVNNVLKYSVEDLYDLSNISIEGLPEICKKKRDLYVLWYNKDQSPYPHPSIVVLYNSLEKTEMAIMIWREEHRIVPNHNIVEDKELAEQSVHEWEPEQKIWKKPDIEEEDVLFRAKIQDKQYLLFFPLE